MTPTPIDVPMTLPVGRRAVLFALRRRGHATAEQLAEQLAMTVSGARQQLSLLADNGLVEVAEIVPETARRGRRSLLYAVTPKADALFPKAYGELTNELLGYLDETDPTMLEALFVKRREARITRANARLEREGPSPERSLNLPASSTKTVTSPPRRRSPPASTGSSNTTPRSGRSRSVTAKPAAVNLTSSERYSQRRMSNASSTWSRVPPTARIEITKIG